MPDGGGSEALEGCSTSVPTSCKVLVSEGEKDRDLDFRIALKRRPCSAEVEAEVPKFRAARAIRRQSYSLVGAHGLERTHGWMETHKQTIKKEETILRRWSAHLSLSGPQCADDEASQAPTCLA